MPRIEFDPKVNVGHIIMALGLVSAGFGLYYSTQAKLEAEATSRKMADAGFERDISGHTAALERITNTLDRMDRDQNDLRIDFETHQARGEGGSK